MGVLKEPEVEHSTPKLIPEGWINSYDFDGVITVGLIPRKVDIVITGRGIDESSIVVDAAKILGFTLAAFVNENPSPYGALYLNPKTKAMGRTRKDSGEHKAKILLKMIANGTKIWNHFDDDPVQIRVIENAIDDRIEDLQKKEKLESAEANELSILTEFHVVAVVTFRQIK